MLAGWIFSHGSGEWEMRPQVEPLCTLHLGQHGYVMHAQLHQPCKAWWRRRLMSPSWVTLTPRVSDTSSTVDALWTGMTWDTDICTPYSPSQAFPNASSPTSLSLIFQYPRPHDPNIQNPRPRDQLARPFTAAHEFTTASFFFFLVEG